MCLLKIEMSSCSRGKPDVTQREHVGVCWLWCGSPVPSLLGIWGIAHHFSVHRFPFQTTTTPYGLHLILSLFGEPRSTGGKPQPSLLLISFLLPPSISLLIPNQSCFFPTCKSSCLTALVLPERRWNHTQPTHRRESARRMGGRTAVPFPSPWPPQGRGSPTCPHSTAHPTGFGDLGRVGTQLFVHEPSFS